MEGNKSLELHLTEAELEALISAVRSTPGGRLPELEFKTARSLEEGTPAI
jgi:hypothetical protein